MGRSSVIGPGLIGRLMLVLLTLATLVHPARAADGAAPQHAQQRPLTREFFVGAWETYNSEFGRNVRIIWTLWADGRLLYHFGNGPDGPLDPGSTGTWALVGGEMHEHWNRRDGSRGFGRGAVERIDDDTVRLTIIDNGHDEYKGLVRIYRRLGPPQLARGLRSIDEPSVAEARR